uniref:Uncharacterized protein MANES_16G135800 n=1 Tax=Rhizophora mucronata TaxID=61149 RepID=A0A2P2P5V9_RHIMU
MCMNKVGPMLQIRTKMPPSGQMVFCQCRRGKLGQGCVTGSPEIDLAHSGQMAKLNVFCSNQLVLKITAVSIA